MMKLLSLTLATLLLSASLTWAAPKIEIVLTAEIDIKEVVNGREVTRRVPAAEAEPGQIIHYTLTYSNSGDAPATDVRLDDPIPQETIYVSGSAFGAGAVITFSADGGQTFQEETRVTYTVTGSDGSPSEKSASPDQYTHIRWTVGNVPVGFTGTAGFRAMVR